MYACPEWLKEHPTASYFGSASPGLGFYHLDIPSDSDTKWLNFENCGMVSVRKGSISIAELEKDFNAIFCKYKKWPWQIRELEPNSFVARFPPWKSIKELSEEGCHLHHHY